MTIQTGTSKSETFIFSPTDTAIDGGGGKDTLVFETTAANLSSTTVTNIEVLKAGLTDATTFTVNQADLVTTGSGSIIGTKNASPDALAAADALLDLTSTVLSSVEIIEAGTTNNTAFTLDQADLAKGGSVIGSTGTGDTLTINGASLDLTSTTLSDVEGLIAGKTTATTFTIDAADLAVLTSITGNSGKDTLVVKDANFDLSGVAASGIEILKAGASVATTFTVDAADLASGGSVLGTAKTDTLIISGATFNLASTILSSVEVLQAGSTNSTTFTLDQADLAKSGSIIGSTSNADTVHAAGSSLDLTSTTLSGIEGIGAGTKLDTTLTINAAQLATLVSVTGGAGNDTLILKGTGFDVTGLTQISVDILKAGATGTTFTVTDPTAFDAITGSTGTDVLIAKTAAFDLSSTDVSGVEKLQAGTTNATTFTVDQADLAKGGSIIGTAKNDNLVAADTSLDLTSTNLSSIEHLTAGATAATTFTLDAADLSVLGSIIGVTGKDDTLVVKASTIDLTTIGLSSIEILKAGLATATTFLVAPGNLAAGGSVVGGNGVDTLTITDTAFDLSSTSLTSVEKLVAGSTNATTFTLDQNDIAAKGSIIGSTGVADTIQTGSTALDLSSTTLSSIENLDVGTTSNTVLTVNQSELANLVIAGSAGSDTVQMAGTLFDLTSTTLTSVENLGAALTSATTFKVDLADLAANGSVTGNTGVDTLIISGTDFNLASTQLTSVEKLMAATSGNTTFSVNQSDLAAGGSVIGGAGSDTLKALDTTLDLSSTALSSIEKIVAGNTNATTFTVNQADLENNVLIQGTAKTDTLAAADTQLNLTSATLSSIDTLTSVNVKGTVFTLDTQDFNGVTTITGSTGTGDALVVLNSLIDLSSTAVTNVETLKAGLNIATTFEVNQADLTAGGSIIGTAGVNSLLAADTQLNLSATSLSSIEVIGATKTSTTFTVDQADLAKGGSIDGAGGSNTLKAAGNSLDLTSTTVSDIDILSTAITTGTTFTITADELNSFVSITGTGIADTLIVTSTDFDVAPFGSGISGIGTLKAGVTTAGTVFTVADPTQFDAIVGSAKTDTLIATTAAFNLSSTALTSVEVLEAGNTGATTFTVDQADLAKGGSVLGVAGKNDILAAAGAQLDLTSTSLSSVEILKAATTNGTTFIVDQTDLAAGGSVLGNTGTDTLQINGTSLDLTSTTLSNVDVLSAGKAAATTFLVDQADLASGGTVQGNTGTDTLVINGATLNLTSTTLSSVEVLQAGTTNATTFIVDQGDLLKGGSVIGVAGQGDTLQVAGTSLDLTSTALSSIEILKAGNTGATTFTVDQADLAANGSVQGVAGKNDTLATNGTALDLTSTTLSSVEILQTNSSAGTTFTVGQADLATGGSVLGGGGTDTLVIAGAALDVTSTTLSSVEVLKAGTTSATTFTVLQTQINAPGPIATIQGNTGSDTLVVDSASINLTSVTLSSIETLAAGTTNATTFTVDQADLASGGAVDGVAGKTDTLIVNASTIDLTSTVLSSIEKLGAGTTNATTFIVDQADLAASGEVDGVAGKDDTLTIKGASLDLTSTTLSSVEILKAGTSSATTFTVDQADLAANGSVIGGAGTDILKINGASLDLTSTALSSVEVLQAGTTNATTFTVDQADLAAGGSVIGVTGKNDTLIGNGATLDLTSTSLSSVEILSTNSTGAATFIVDQADLAANGSIDGVAGKNDTLQINGTSLDLTATSLSSVEILQAGTSSSTTFIVGQTDLLSGGSVIGGAGTDTLQAGAASLDLTSTTLTSVEVLKAGTTNATTFTVDQADLATNGSVIGNTGTDILATGGASLDLTSTALSSVEVLRATGSNATTFTVDQADLAANGSVQGVSGKNDTLIIKGTSFDLSSTQLSSIEILQAGSTAATTFKLDAADLASGGSLIGVAGQSDTLIAAGASLDLSSTTVSSIEVLKAGATNPTTFTVLQTQINAPGSIGSIQGNVSSDTLVVDSASIDLTSVVLSSIEVLQAGTTNATTFTVDQADLASGGGVNGVSGKNDTLLVDSSTIDLTSTVLSSVEILKAGTTNPTTFIVDQADLASGGSVQGTTGVDILQAAGATLDISSTTLSSIEELKAGSTNATTFTVNDLTGIASVVGGSGTDILKAAAATLDLTSVSLSSIEVLQAANTAATTFTVNQADIASLGSINGVVGKNDTLIIAGSSLDLTSTVLSSIEILKAGTASNTSFTVDQTDLISGGSVQGSTGTDTLIGAGTALDLTGTTLSSIEVLTVASTAAALFTLDQSDLLAGITVQGHSGVSDTLTISGTTFDVTSATLSSVDILKAGASGTTFTVDQNDLAAGGSILGSSGTDILKINGASLDLTSTSLSSVEHLEAGTTNATTFTVDQADLASNGSIDGVSGKTDTLVIHGTSLDLTSTSLSSIEVLKTDSSLATTFTVDAADLAAHGTVMGGAGTDTLTVASATIDLDSISTVLSSIETLKAGTGSATTFTLSQSQLASGLQSLIGGAGSDTLIVNSTTIDLSSLTLSSVETFKAADASSGVHYTLGSGEGGLTLDLTVNTQSDEVSFAGNYKATDVTSDSTILAHTVTLNHFAEGGEDTIDIAALANGTPTKSQDITGFIDLVQPATLKDALDIAASGHGGTTSTVVSFQYSGDTYVLVDKSDSTTLTADDAVIKLAGTHNLTDADFVF